MCLLDCGPQRDDAGELLPSPALFAEEAVGEGLWDAGVHDKIFHRSRQRTDAFQGDVAIFFFSSWSWEEGGSIENKYVGLTAKVTTEEGWRLRFVRN